jgi:hypothetical protein
MSGPDMRRQLRWYGAGPLHLLALLACFGLAGYAAARLVPSQPLGVAAWFLGAVIGHDLLLMPLYSLADRSAMAAIRHRHPQLPVTPWINYVRVPAALSGLLLLVWFPLILRLRSPYHASTTLSADPYVWHWLAVTGALFLLSAVAFALRLRRGPRAALPLEPRAPALPPQRPAPTSAPAVLEERKPEIQEPEIQEPEIQEPEIQEPEIQEPEEQEPGQDAVEPPPAEADSRPDPSPEHPPGPPPRPTAEDPPPQLGPPFPDRG